ncbi:MAG: excinuclease ABC subunit UvrC [Oscillospiraceae bacterium]|jgi:excinuclease ABC subunit C|nr:excinuclease ABC subunit UvrC [Oscillospiraceae bacterium]
MSEPDALGKKARGLPGLPGVYIMIDKSGEVIYVGKAVSLRNRVSSYFHGQHNAKTEAMVSKIDRFDVIVVGTEFEALVLENQLIKRHMPKYNILLKDDKGHPYIRIDPREAYPSFSVVSRSGGDGAKYLGPYSGRGVCFSAIEAVSKVFGLPTCTRAFPRDIGRERPCISRELGLCKGWCAESDGNTPEAYAADIKNAVAVFEGASPALAHSLTAEMEEAAAALRFETAAALRDKIRAVSELSRKQYIVSSSRADTDAVGFFRGAAKSCFTVLHYIGGTLLGKDSSMFDTPLEDDADALSGLVRQYYSRRGVFPGGILLKHLPEDAEALARFLSESAGHAVTVEAPKRGDLLRRVGYATLNAREDAERSASREDKIRKTIEWIGYACGLPSPPVRMESFDISNTGDDDIAASMVVFENGKPKRAAYRKFKIETTDGQDDYHSMEEAVTRRAKRFIGGDETFAPLPDMFLIDGGTAHASVAEKALRSLGIETPVFGMVKDNRHRTRALVTPDGREIGIDSYPSAFALIGTIQEETHRFAIEYHRKLRDKSLRKSKLDAIPGVGEKRRNDLLRAFGSLTRISEATLDELHKIVPRNAAEAVYAYLHGDAVESSGETAQTAQNTAETQTGGDAK